MKVCESCGNEYSLSLKNKLARKLISAQARAFPLLKATVEDSKNFCKVCYTKTVEPMAKAHLGIYKNE